MSDDIKVWEFDTPEHADRIWEAVMKAEGYSPATVIPEHGAEFEQVITAERGEPQRFKRIKVPVRDKKGNIKRVEEWEEPLGFNEHPSVQEVKLSESREREPEPRYPLQDNSNWKYLPKRDRPRQRAMTRLASGSANAGGNNA